VAPSFSRNVTRSTDRVISCIEKTVDDWFLEAMTLGEPEKQGILVVFQVPAGIDGKET